MEMIEQKQLIEVSYKVIAEDLMKKKKIEQMIFKS